MNKKAWLIIGIIAAILLVASASIFYTKYKSQILSAQNSTTAAVQGNSNNSSAKKQMAPDFSLKDINGNPVKLSDYKGKIVILNFWAVWCKYCKQEMPDLNELNKTLLKDDKAVILAIDSEEDINTVKSYLTESKISMNILMDSDGSITKEYGITGFPTTFIINRDGSLYKYIQGATDKEALTNIINEIK